MSKDDMETNTMNVMFDGRDDTDKDDEELKVKARTEDDYYWSVYNRKHITNR